MFWNLSCAPIRRADIWQSVSAQTTSNGRKIPKDNELDGMIERR
jgi:hypothetical protein